MKWRGVLPLSNLAQHEIKTGTFGRRSFFITINIYPYPASPDFDGHTDPSSGLRSPSVSWRRDWLEQSAKRIERYSTCCLQDIYH